MPKRNMDSLKLQTLMNKNVEVLDFLYDSETHSIFSVETVKDIQYAPLQILDYKFGVTIPKLNDWWQNRAIPLSRENIKGRLSEIGIQTPTELQERSFGLSLSDQYWVKDANSNISWSDINFFQNEFSEDIGNYLLGNQNVCESLISPDNSSDGMLQKKWKIINDKRCLIKGGNSIYNQEPFDEVIATTLYRRLLDEDEFVEYFLYEENDKYYSICEDMIGINTELVPAYAISNTQKQRSNDSMYEHYIHCCKQLGILDVRSKIEKMIVCDYILANIDRHWGNFGAIRDVNTLKFIGLAPLFDNGTSLHSKTNTFDIKPYHEKLTKNNPFKNSFKSQLKLVSDLDWFNSDKLDGFLDEVEYILSKNKYVDLTRKDKIIKLIQSNIAELNSYKKTLCKSVLNEDLDINISPINGEKSL